MSSKARQAMQAISIHALLAESDSICQVRILPGNAFLSTLSLRRATAQGYQHRDQQQFLSTLSLRRATVWSPQARTRKRDFYPRSPCGERPIAGVSRRKGGLISIHALLAESDRLMKERTINWHQFLSTLSLRRATAKVHKTVGYFCAYETNFMEIASSC